MTILTIQIHEANQGWIDAAELSFVDEKNIRIEYDIEFGSKYIGRKDLYALSLTNKVDLNVSTCPMPGYLMDLIPQGNVLKRLLGYYEIGRDSEYEKILSQIPLASPGNIRVKEPWIEIENARATYSHPGFERRDIINNSTTFVEYMRDHGAPIGGTSGAGGGAPKFLLREDRQGMYHADGYLDDQLTKQAWLIKLPFTDSNNSKLLLNAERGFYSVLSDLGLNVGKSLEWEKDVLFIPRFDRVRLEDGLLHYYGLESFYSAAGISIYGAPMSHEKNLEMIMQHSANSQMDVLEYIKRDVAYLALANNDNHGRNSSFIKKDGSVILSPIYDVTCMKYFQSEIISPLTNWTQENNTLGKRLSWVNAKLGLDQKIIQQSIEDFAEKMKTIEDLLHKHGVPVDIIDRTAGDRKQAFTDLKTIE